MCHAHILCFGSSPKILHETTYIYFNASFIVNANSKKAKAHPHHSHLFIRSLHCLSRSRSYHSTYSRRSPKLPLSSSCFKPIPTVYLVYQIDILVASHISWISLILPTRRLVKPSPDLRKALQMRPHHSRISRAVPDASAP